MDVIIFGIENRTNYTHDPSKVLKYLTSCEFVNKPR